MPSIHPGRLYISEIARNTRRTLKNSNASPNYIKSYIGRAFVRIRAANDTHIKLTGEGAISPNLAGALKLMETLAYYAEEDEER